MMLTSCENDTIKQHSILLPRLRLSSFDPLEKINGRQKCPECGKRRMYFCYDCRVHIADIGQLVPGMELPIFLDIIKHQRELNGKSTAVHAALLAPKQTRIFDKFVDVPDYTDCPGTVVLCPSKQSISIDEFVLANGPIQRLIVLDSTWNTIRSLKSLPQLAKMPWIHLRNYETEYWRPQTGLSSEYLSTIEAIYFACCECSESERRWRVKNDTKSKEGDLQNFDQLLFWFYFLRKKVPI